MKLMVLTLILSFASVKVDAKEWVGMLAVKESPLVNQVIRDSGNDPVVYGPRLRKLLDTGQIKPAPGRYCMQPFANGRRDDRPECQHIQTGIWSRWAPDHMVGKNRAMCIKVPDSWPAIAGQRYYPANGGFRYNCYDFTAADKGRFYDRRHAAMVVVIQPAN